MLHPTKKPSVRTACGNARAENARSIPLFCGTNCMVFLHFWWIWSKHNGPWPLEWFFRMLKNVRWLSLVLLSPSTPPRSLRCANRIHRTKIGPKVSQCQAHRLPGFDPSKIKGVAAVVAARRCGTG
jgi:hypothetical protein